MEIVQWTDGKFSLRRHNEQTDSDEFFAYYPVIEDFGWVPLPKGEKRADSCLFKTVKELCLAYNAIMDQRKNEPTIAKVIEFNSQNQKGTEA